MIRWKGIRQFTCLPKRIVTATHDGSVSYKIGLFTELNHDNNVFMVFGI